MNAPEPAWILLSRKAWRRVQLDDVNSRLKTDPASVTKQEFDAVLHEAQRAARAVKKMDLEEAR